MFNKASNPFNGLFVSIDNLLEEEKEQKLKQKLGKKIKDNIFTEEILAELNESDFSEIEEENIPSIFANIFPVFVTKDNTVFRLYKHKIEVDLSDQMKDRYIFMFTDGRLTSGLFKCFNLSHEEYCYGIKKIIDTIPYFKQIIIKALSDYRENAINHHEKIKTTKEKEAIAEKNYNTLIEYLDTALKGE